MATLYAACVNLAGVPEEESSAGAELRFQLSLLALAIVLLTAGIVLVS